MITKKKRFIKIPSCFISYCFFFFLGKYLLVMKRLQDTKLYKEARARFQGATSSLPSLDEIRSSNWIYAVGAIGGALAFPYFSEIASFAFDLLSEYNLLSLSFGGMLGASLADQFKASTVNRTASPSFSLNEEPICRVSSVSNKDRLMRALA